MKMSYKKYLPSNHKNRLSLLVIALILCCVLLTSCSADTENTPSVPINAYTAGRCIAESGFLSSIAFDGSGYGNITIEKDRLTVKSGYYDTAFVSDSIETQEYTRDKLIKKFEKEFMEFKSDSSKYFPADCKNITEIKYIEKNSDTAFCVYWCNDIPLIFSDGFRLYELVPDTNNLEP